MKDEGGHGSDAGDRALAIAKAPQAGGDQHAQDLSALRDKWENSGVALSVQHSPSQNLLTLSKVVVPKDRRGAGVGSAVMNDLTAHADKHGKTIALSPDTSFGASSVGRLKDFYNGHGFVENKGRNRDFSLSESMYREPRQARAHGGGVGKRPMFHSGPIHSSVAGRTDQLPMTVKNGSYVLPADCVSHAGENNTIHGFKVLKMAFSGAPYGGGKTPYGQSGGPYGAAMPKAAGGEASDDEGVEIIAAGGEYVLTPDEVRQAGGGDLERGHRVLDEFVKRSRAEHVKTLEKLPGPAKS